MTEGRSYEELLAENAALRAQVVAAAPRETVVRPRSRRS